MHPDPANQQTPGAPPPAGAPYPGERSVPEPYAPQPAGPHRRYGWVWVIVAVCVIALAIGTCVGAMSLFGSGIGDALPTGSTIAVIPIDGLIAGSGSAASGVITPEAFSARLEKATEDPQVKAIVLRIDSPGGTVAASEEISTYVRQSSKPVVASIGDVGASGAYMVASQADKIVANPGSAVGSIGVISEIPNVRGLLDKLGVEFTVIHAGTYKDTGSPYRPLTPTETALIQGQVDEVYGQFIDIVAVGRNLPRSEVESLATGWAWNGAAAKDLKLVDSLGTYQDALKLAAGLGGITGTYKTVTYGGAKLTDLLDSLIGMRDQLTGTSALDRLGIAAPSPALAK